MKEWFTPAKRKAIYQVGYAIGTLLVVYGVVTAGDINKATDALTALTGLILTLTNLLASLNVNASE